MKKMTVILTAFWLPLVGALNAGAETVEYDGLIEPFVVIDIGAPDPGIIQKVAVERGSEIKKGDLLVALDALVEQAEYERAKSLAGFTGDVDLQETQLAFVKRVNQRVEKLSVISAHDRDQAATEVMLTTHRLRKARENQLLAQKELKKAKVALGRRSIRSPITGVVVERYVSRGEFVDSQPLLRLAQIDPLRIEVIVPGHVFGRIQPGMTATIVPDLLRYDKQTATVTIVDKVIDSASSTFGVRLELSNDEDRMPSGLKCMVCFELADDDSVVREPGHGIDSTTSGRSIANDE